MVLVIRVLGHVLCVLYGVVVVRAQWRVRGELVAVRKWLCANRAVLGVLGHVHCVMYKMVVVRASSGGSGKIAAVREWETPLRTDPYSDFGES